MTMLPLVREQFQKNPHQIQDAAKFQADNPEALLVSAARQERREGLVAEEYDFSAG